MRLPVRFATVAGWGDSGLLLGAPSTFRTSHGLVQRAFIQTLSPYERLLRLVRDGDVDAMADLTSEARRRGDIEGIVCVMARKEPSIRAFSELVWLLEHWQGGGLMLAIDEAERALSLWPDGARLAPCRWADTLVKNPRWLPS